MTRSLQVAAVAALCCLALTACAGRNVRTTNLADGPSWPASDPHVQLETIIDLGREERRRDRPVVFDAGQSRPYAHRPYAAAWSGEDLVVVDPDIGRILRIKPSGRLERSRADLFTRPVGVAACRDGLVVSDSVTGQVTMLDQELEFVAHIARDLERPTGVVCAGGTVFVAETARHRIVSFSLDGTRVEFGGRGVQPGDFNFPTVLAAADGPSGEPWLLVGDTLNFRIQILNRISGEPVRDFGKLGDSPGHMPRLKGIAVDAAGHLWVSDAHLDRVSLFDLDGTLLLSIGGYGNRLGEFSFPVGVASGPNGQVAVVDSYNRRIQVFRLLQRG